MTLFLHSKNPMKTVDRDSARTIGDLLATEGGGGELWLENADEPLTADTKLTDLPPNAHVSHGTCTRVATTVKFNGEKEQKNFPPGATVATVFAWATGEQGYDLPAGQRPKHTLVLCGTQTQPDKATHLSELVTSDCTVCFELLPKVRFEG
jgi:hypothetical protein